MYEKRKLYIKTFGCQMNDADSSKIKNLLADMSIGSTPAPEDADIILLNTCSIRWKAEHKVYSELGRLKRIKNKRPGVIIGVGGCVAQQEKKEMFRRAPHLDLVFGTHNIHRIPEMIRKLDSKRCHLMETAFFDSPEPLVYPAPEEDGVRAYVNIIRGCDNFCSYCIVPYVRGREVSRPSSGIIDEITTLTEKGVREVTLLGQNVNSYGKGLSENISFAGLVDKVEKIEGIERIRFATSHPRDLSDELIAVFGESKKLCSHLHLPVQSGSNPVLMSMKRGYTVDSYLKKVERLKKKRPDISLTTDLIIGFPGESGADFEQTLELMKTIVYDSAFSFKYSSRPGTEAARLEDTVSDEEKDERLAILQSLQREHQMARNRAEEGKVMMILVEGESRKGDGMVMGRNSGNKVVNFKGPKEIISSTVPVKIRTGLANSLYGEPVH